MSKVFNALTPPFDQVSDIDTINELTDVDTTGVSDLDFLQYQTDTWVDFDLFGTANTWSALNTYTSNVTLTSDAPVLTFDDTGDVYDWTITNDSKNLTFSPGIVTTISRFVMGSYATIGSDITTINGTPELFSINLSNVSSYGAGFTLSMFGMRGTFLPTPQIGTWWGVIADPVVDSQYTSAFGLGEFSLFRAQPVLQTSAANGKIYTPSVFYSFPHIRAVNTGAEVSTYFGEPTGVFSGLRISRSASNTLTVTEFNCFLTGKRSVFSDSTVEAGTTLTTLNHIKLVQPAVAGTLTTQYGMHILTLTGGTSNYGIWIDNADEGAIVLDQDGIGGRIYFGEGQDATIDYDGTDFIIDPDVVGTGRVLIGATGDDDMLLNDIEIDGDLNHDGANIGFYGVAPVARPAAYTQTYATATRTHAARTAPAAGAGSGADATTFSGAECDALVADQQDTAQVLNQLIDDLQANGVLQ